MRFALKADPQMDVFIAGSFNDWNPKKKRMKPVGANGDYEATMLIHPGRHEYKFVVDGEWRADPSNPEWTNDGMGSMNSVLHV